MFGPQTIIRISSGTRDRNDHRESKDVKQNEQRVNSFERDIHPSRVEHEAAVFAS